jgi:hypothetical protein
VVLEARVRVDGDVGVAGVLEEAADDGEGLVEVPLVVRRRPVRARDPCGDHVRVRLHAGPRARPAVGSREVGRCRVPEEHAVDGRATADEATGKVADVCDNVSPGSDDNMKRLTVAPPELVGVVELRLEQTGDVELGVVRARRPRRLVRAAGDAVRRTTALEEQNLLAGLRQTVRRDETAVPGADDDVVVRRRERRERGRGGGRGRGRRGHGGSGLRRRRRRRHAAGEVLRVVGAVRGRQVDAAVAVIRVLEERRVRVRRLVNRSLGRRVAEPGAAVLGHRAAAEGVVPRCGGSDQDVGGRTAAMRTGAVLAAEDPAPVRRVDGRVWERRDLRVGVERGKGVPAIFGC